MPNLLERLRNAADDPSSVDSELVAEAAREIAELREKGDKMEEILIVLVRTGFPWDEEGRPDERFESFRTRYTNLLHEASDLLGLDLRSSITRTEPRTM